MLNVAGSRASACESTAFPSFPNPVYRSGCEGLSRNWKCGLHRIWGLYLCGLEWNTRVICRKSPIMPTEPQQLTLWPDYMLSGQMPFFSAARPMLVSRRKTCLVAAATANRSSCGIIPGTCFFSAKSLSPNTWQAATCYHSIVHPWANQSGNPATGSAKARQKSLFPLSVHTSERPATDRKRITSLDPSKPGACLHGPIRTRMPSAQMLGWG